MHDDATDVVQLLDALAIDRAVLAADSGACMTARRVALDHPGRVAGLVLEPSPTTLVGDAAAQETLVGRIPSATLSVYAGSVACA